MRLFFLLAGLVAALGISGLFTACGGGSTGPAFVISSPETLPQGEVHEPYGPIALVASGGTPPYSFSATQKPAWLVLNAQTGVLTGTPDAIGSFTVTVTATDSANPPRSSQPRTYTLRVSDSRPPDTSLTAGPCNLQQPCFTSQTAATFNFLSTEPLGATFRCFLDGQPISPCIPPQTLPGPLSEGPHTFTVAAVDSANNVDLTPASFTWTVDLTPPAAPSLFNLIAGDERLILQFSAPPDPDVASYRVFRSTSPIADINTCNCAIEVIPASGSPMEYRSRGLTNGITYYHRIAAIDLAGNQGPASQELSGSSSEILISNTASLPHRAVSAFDGSRFLVVWDTDQNNNPLNPNYDIRGAFIHPDGYLSGPPFNIAQGAGNQQNPQIAYDSGRNQYIVVWEDSDGGTSSIKAARILPNGAVLDPSGQLVASPPDTQLSPNVACGDSGCLIVWQTLTAATRTIGYARFADGLLDPSPSTLYEVPAGDIPRRVSVTASPSLFLVTWSSSLEGDSFAIRVGWSSVQDSQPVRLSSAAGDQGRPLASPVSPMDPNSSFLIVWEDDRAGFNDRNDIWGVVLPPSGPPSAEIAFSVGSPGTKSLTAVSTSRNGLKGLIAWADSRDSPVAPRIYYLRLNLVPAPAPTGPETPASGLFQQTRPRVSNGFSRFLMTWLDYRRTTDENNPIIDIYGHTVDE
jgi:hypothetical protein